MHGNFRVRVVHARLRVLLPAMPRANQLAVEGHSLTQRPATMQADVVHGAVSAVHVGDADRLVAAGKLFGRVGGGEVGLSGELYELCHIGIAKLSEENLPPAPPNRGRETPLSETSDASDSSHLAGGGACMQV